MAADVGRRLLPPAASLSSLLIGVALGNIAWGVPIDDHGEFAGTFLGLLTPYPLLSA